MTLLRVHIPRNTALVATALAVGLIVAGLALAAQVVPDVVSMWSSPIIG